MGQRQVTNPAPRTPLPLSRSSFSPLPFHRTAHSYHGPAAITSSTPGAARGALDANIHFGARVVEGGNITLPNGSLDPWHALGVVNASDPFHASGSPQETGPGVVVVELVATAHCRDMYAPGALEAAGINDTAAVVWAHGVIAAQVAHYVGAAAPGPGATPSPTPRGRVHGDDGDNGDDDDDDEYEKEIRDARLPLWSVFAMTGLFGIVVGVAATKASAHGPAFVSGGRPSQQRASGYRQFGQEQPPPPSSSQQPPSSSSSSSSSSEVAAAAVASGRNSFGSGGARTASRSASTPSTAVGKASGDAYNPLQGDMHGDMASDLHGDMAGDASLTQADSGFSTTLAYVV